MPFLRPFRAASLALQLVGEHRERNRLSTPAELAAASERAMAAAIASQQAAMTTYGVHAFVPRGREYIEQAKALGIRYMQADGNDFRRCAICTRSTGGAIHGGEYGKHLQREVWRCQVCQLDPDQCAHEWNPFKVKP